MHSSQASDPKLLAHYEGLVRKTASMCEPHVEEEFDDIAQALRIKVWQALLAYDPTKARQTLDAYVFMCVFNRVKDLKKKVRRNLLFIEDVASADANGYRERFDARYFAAEEEEVYAEVMQEAPLIPNTLGTIEIRVITYLYLDYSQAEIARREAMTRKDVQTVVVGIREKLADWRPSTPEVLPAAA